MSKAYLASFALFYVLNIIGFLLIIIWALQFPINPAVFIILFSILPALAALLTVKIFTKVHIKPPTVKQGRSLFIGFVGIGLSFYIFIAPIILNILSRYELSLNSKIKIGIALLGITAVWIALLYIVMKVPSRIASNKFKG